MDPETDARDGRSTLRVQRWSVVCCEPEGGSTSRSYTIAPTLNGVPPIKIRGERCASGLGGVAREAVKLEGGKVERGNGTASRSGTRECRPPFWLREVT